jgi:L-lactate dehydrogenase
MTGKVGVVGAGRVGAEAAFLLTRTPGIREVLLLDIDRARADAEALDIAHGAVFNGGAQIRAGDYDSLRGADVVIVAAGASLRPGQTRLDLLSQNVGIASDVIAQVVQVAPEAVLLFVTNPVDVMPAIAVRRFGVPPGRAIGTGCALDTGRLRVRLAQHLDISAQSIQADVLGEHGDSQVVHWSGAQAAGMPLTRFAERAGRPLPVELREALATEVRTAAYRIKQGKGVSNAGIAGCVTRLARAIVLDERVAFPITTFRDDLLGISRTAFSLPATLSAGGASDPMLPDLNTVELAALQQSGIVLQQVIARALTL